MAEDVDLGDSRTGKIRSFWVGFFLAVITVGIYYYFWYYLVNDELKDIGISREDAKLADSSPGTSVIAVLIGWIIIIPPPLSVYNYGHRIRRAETIVGVDPSEQINPLVAFLLYFPGGILLIPLLFHYWYVTKHQNLAVGAGGSPD